MSNKVVKTNALRLLDKQHITYNIHTYDWQDDALVGHDILQEGNLYKTIVVIGKSQQLYVCVIPIGSKLNLKRIAQLTHEKSVELFPVEHLENATGYIRGGCSPIGMKKSYPIFLDSTVNQQQTIIISAGKKGVQVELSVVDLKRMINAIIDDLTE